jgi:glycosyltransferase involved in cell wall biosynthesis
MTPFFSIIIPTFNSEKTLDETLKSVSLQSMRDFELIISDGASTDKTIKIAGHLLQKSRRSQFHQSRIQASTTPSTKR